MSTGMSSSPFSPINQVKNTVNITTQELSSTLINKGVTESGTVPNLIDQDMCFCGKHIDLVASSTEPTINCVYCQKKYHADCMKRDVDLEVCAFCHLKLMLPNRQVKKTLFVGLLLKGRKRHEFTVPISEEDLSIQYKVQVRCFKLNKNCQTNILFPDSIAFNSKNYTIKEMAPLHRQSSLKFRKDEPFYIPSHYVQAK